MPAIRRAETKECETLSEIAARSEAYWGYDQSFMDTFRVLYSVTEKFISENPVFVVEEDGRIVGFYGLSGSVGETSLEYLYVDPQYIGKGYGKVLWRHMVDNCRALGVKEVTLVTSPQAKEFYIKMGAVETGEVESLVMKGRRIPRLVYSLGE
jgi:N-acetylglutamate synthase-like GNAT family acetyltransferase